VHDNHTGWMPILALVLLAAVLASGCTAERKGGAPAADSPAIRVPDLPEPPPATMAVPGSEEAPCPFRACIREPG
jgi:hypothetical protein